MSRRLKSRPLQIEDHVCAQCFARILSSVGADGVKIYICPTCDRQEAGATPHVICSCGATTPKGRNLGYRCTPNPHKSNESPYAIVAVQH